MPRVEPQHVGRLRERVTCERFVTTGEGPDATQEWQTLFGRVAAEVLPLGAVERMQAQATGARVAYTVRVRYREGIAAEEKDRLTWHAEWGDLPLEIAGVFDPDGRRVHVVMECAEVV